MAWFDRIGERLPWPVRVAAEWVLLGGIIGAASAWLMGGGAVSVMGFVVTAAAALGVGASVYIRGLQDDAAPPRQEDVQAAIGQVLYDLEIERAKEQGRFLKPDSGRDRISRLHLH